MTPVLPEESMSVGGAEAAVSSPLEYSVVVACFNESQTSEEFHAALRAELDTLDRACEVIYVNDGSEDDTLDKLQHIFASDSRVTHLLDLMHNVGQNYAQAAGVCQTSGKHIVFMDSDLQIYPSALRDLLAKFEEGYDMVGGFRVRRRDRALRRLISGLGNFVVRTVTGVMVRDLGCGLKVVDGGLLRSYEPGPYRPLDAGAIFMGLRRVAEVPVEHHPRRHGRTRWTARRFFMLYRNVLANLAPPMYPVLLAGLLAVFGAVFLYFLGALLIPSIVPFSRHPALVPLLLSLSILINLGFFLLIGETVLQAQTRKAPAYILRSIWSRPLPATER